MAVLVEYFCGRDEGHLFIVKAAGEPPTVIPFSFPLDAVYEGLYSYLTRLGEDGEEKAGEELRSLVQPVVEHSAEDEVVWIVPHGLLHYLPFHALPTTEGFLGFRNPVCYTPSASTLPVCRSAPRLDGKAVVTLGDPLGDLRYARYEAESVAGSFRGELWVGGAATKEALFSVLDQHAAFDIVHFACHGKAGAEDPLQAGVLLAPDLDHREMGVDMLTAGEILRQKLRAGLVTVSACDAGLGEIETSDEVLGLTRALLYAGAASVLLSYWPVDDFSTYLTIERFYEDLQTMIAEGGGNKAFAIRSAQRYVHDLTMREVIDRCDSVADQRAAQSDLRGQIDFLIEAAELVIAANDLDEALRRYERIRELGDGSPSVFAGRLPWIQDRFEELEFRTMLERDPVDYTVQPFRGENHWASFFLHGDWKL